MQAFASSFAGFPVAAAPAPFSPAGPLFPQPAARRANPSKAIPRFIFSPPIPNWPRHGCYAGRARYYRQPKRGQAEVRWAVPARRAKTTRPATGCRGPRETAFTARGQKGVGLRLIVRGADPSMVSDGRTTV